MKRNSTFWGVLGTILFTIGAILTIAFVVKGEQYLYWLFVTGALVIGGILLIAWVFGE